MLEDCGPTINDLARLKALEETGLMDSPVDESFQRLSRMAAKVLKAPISVFSLIGKDRQYFKSTTGLPPEAGPGSDFPLDVSVCQYALIGKPLIIEDTKNHPAFKNNPAVIAMNIAGYLGIPLITKDGYAIGTVCVFDLNKRLWTDEDIANLTDITESFITEVELRKELKKSNEEKNDLKNEKLKLEAIFLESPAAMALYKGPTFVFEMVNKKWKELVSEREYLGKTFNEVYPELTQSPLPGILKKVFETGETFSATEMRIPFLQKNGAVDDRYYDFSYVRVLDANGKPTSLFCHALDVTERVLTKFRIEDNERLLAEAAKELTNERRKLENIIIESQTGIALVRGPSLIFEIVNQKFAELVGPRKYIGRTWEEIYWELPNSEFPKIMRKVLETGEPFFVQEMEIPVEVSPGVIEKRFYDFSYIRALDGEGNPYGIYFQCNNVTHYVELKNDAQLSANSLATSIKKLERERELRERFVAALSHDLRTPLTAAKMSSEIIARKLVDNPELFKAAQRITDNMNRADSMIRDILDASLIKAGEKIHLRIEKCILNEIIIDVIEDLVGIHGDKFLVTIEESIEGFWDLNGIKRIIENLLSNAIKYGEIGTKVKITAKKLSKDVLLTVHNKGYPIPPNELTTLFDQFKRSHTAQMSSQKGWGLGLTLVKGITETHGGNVSVSSDSVSGTSFTVEIPLDAR